MNRARVDLQKNPWSLDSNQITPLIVQSMRDQQNKIVAAEAAIQELKAQNEELKSRIKVMEMKLP